MNKNGYCDCEEWDLAKWLNYDEDTNRYYFGSNILRDYINFCPFCQGKIYHENNSNEINDFTGK